jgi:hypothetical protein
MWFCLSPHPCQPNTIGRQGNKRRLSFLLYGFLSLCAINYLCGGWMVDTSSWSEEGTSASEKTFKGMHMAPAHLLSLKRTASWDYNSLIRQGNPWSVHAIHIEKQEQQNNKYEHRKERHFARLVQSSERSQWFFQVGSVWILICSRTLIAMLIDCLLNAPSAAVF